MAAAIGAALEPEVNWRAELAKWIVASLPHDFTWRRPNRKSASLGVYLPGSVKEGLVVIVHTDTSGSISDELLSQFLAEIRSILTSFQNVDMTLIVCDAEIQEVIHLTSDNVPERLKFKGRGGTSHTPVVEWINANASDARLFITLTDGYSDIESCFENLPETCERLILLKESSHALAEALSEYGVILEVDYAA